MGVSITGSKQSNGKTYLRIKYTKSGHEDIVESLGVYIFTKPKSNTERRHNKSTWESVNIVLQEKRGTYLLQKFGIHRYLQGIGLIELMKHEARKKTTIKTRQSWDSVVNNVFAYLGNQDINISEFTEDDADKLFTHFKKSMRESSARTYMAKVKATIKEAKKKKIVLENVAEDISTSQKASKKRIFLTMEEIKILKNTPCKREDIKGAFLFACLCGLRISDVMAFDVSLLNYDSSIGTYYYQFKQQKTDEALIPISMDAFTMIPKNGLKQPFSGLPKNNVINTNIRKWVVKAGINKKVTFHTSRHTFGTLHATHGTDIFIIQNLMGHSDIATTQVYVNLVDEKKMNAVKNIPEL